MNIEPATLAQVTRGRGGRKVLIDDDVAGVASDLRLIHPSLRLAFNERGGYFVVYQLLEDGSEHLVTTAQECDQRLVERVWSLTAPDYDLSVELDRLEAQIARERDHRFAEEVGERSERLAHAIRKDLGTQNRAFIKENQHG